jgi:hypothetical protein
MVGMQRRAQPRKPGESVIELFADDGTLVARGSLRNVSERGLGVAELEPVVPRELVKGDRFSVRFEIASEAIGAEARVQWINDGQRVLGLKMSPDAPSAAKLASFLSDA